MADLSAIANVVYCCFCWFLYASDGLIYRDKLLPSHKSLLNHHSWSYTHHIRRCITQTFERVSLDILTVNRSLKIAGRMDRILVVILMVIVVKLGWIGVPC